MLRVMILSALYLKSRMRFTTAFASALLGLPVLAEVMPRQSNADLSAKYVFLLAYHR